MTSPTFNDSQVLAQLDSGWHWGSGSISYRFASNTANLGGTTETLQFVAPNASQQSVLAIALRGWSDLIRPAFVQTDSANSNIDIAYSGSLGGAYALTYFPSRGTVWMDSTSSSLTAPVIGRYGFMAIVHEIGHALGLNHMGSYDGAGAWAPSSYQDSVVYTLMSYFGPNAFQSSPDVADADWIGLDGQAYQPQTPMLNDVMAIQSIYGASTTTRAGDTVYGFHAAPDPVYDFNSNAHPILTLYDAGGTDTLDLSGWASDAEIDLRPGSFSSANGMTRNIAIARNTQIENLVGGGGHDRLTGNSAANWIDGGDGNDLILSLDGNDRVRGGRGDDVIDGGNGIDTVVFAGSAAEHRVQRQADGNLIVSGSADGTDTLVRVERLRFDDGSLAYDLDAGGTAGTALRLLQLITGNPQLGDRALVGEGIDMVASMGMAGVTRMLIDTGTVARYAGGGDDAHLLTLLFRNIVGNGPSAAELADLQAFVASNHMSQADALAYAAQLDGTAQRIDLAGLAAQGVGFNEWGG